MKPRNKTQRHVVESAKTLSPLTGAQTRQAIRRSVQHLAHCNRHGVMTCYECGHTWQGEDRKHVTCPHCGTRLEVTKCLQRTFKLTEYFMTITTCAGYQVLRTYLITATLRRGEPACYTIAEAYQRWIDAKGRSYIIARKRAFMSRYVDSFNYNTEMELRHEHIGHSIIPACIVGKVRVIPTLTRNGFDGRFHDIAPHRLFTALLTDNRLETLLKTGQTELLKYFCHHGYEFAKLWPSVRVALRHHYIVRDASLWADLIGYLEYMGKDTRNPQLICPTNLLAAHDLWLQHKRTKQSRERAAADRQRRLNEEQAYFANATRVAEDEAAYRAAKARFFDIVLTDTDLTIIPLRTIRDFADEAATHHHCVFTQRYFRRADALILHAVIAGRSVATIELSLTSLEVIQCRASHNAVSPHHDRIVSLIRRNLNQFASRLTA